MQRKWVVSLSCEGVMICREMCRVSSRFARCHGVMITKERLKDHLSNSGREGKGQSVSRPFTEMPLA